MRTCKFCGAPFVPARHSQVYCSRGHQHAANCRRAGAKRQERLGRHKLALSLAEAELELKRAARLACGEYDHRLAVAKATLKRLRIVEAMKRRKART